MPAELELEREQALLHQLRASGDPAALREAGQLQTLYHDRQMDGLAADVYQAAKGTGHPPAGWTRLSEHPELVSRFAERLHISPAKLLETLHPDPSGFRAEIYLPDAAMQQAGFKATLAFKGSSGDVMTSEGKRHDTTTEDFAANNFPQSVGLETDYYDRAMQLGYELKQNGVDFESTGHSLAGGMAAATAAVTGTLATTFNAAGLNPVTTERFAQQNPGVVVAKDLTHLITNYQVQGELLSDSVQNNFHNMDTLRRMELGAVLKETSGVLQRVPQARELFAQKLGTGLSPQAQGTVNAFVNKLSTGDDSRLLHDLPLAAGSQHVLAAMTRDAQGRLEPRVPVTSLPEDTRLMTPLLESLAVVAEGARVGERSGEVVAAGGHLAARGLHGTGRGVDGAAQDLGASMHSTTRTEGVVMQAGEHALGATLAGVRTAQAEVSARVDQGLGQAEHFGAEFDAALLRGAGPLLPASAQHTLQAQAERLHQVGLEAQRQAAAAAAVDRQRGQANATSIRNVTHDVEAATLHGAEAYGAAQQTVIGGAGHYARAGLDGTARGLESASQQAPAAFATLGAATAAEVVLAAELNPKNFPRLLNAAEAGSHMEHDAAEAFERHLMKETVTPSMDAHVAFSERQAEKILHQAALRQMRDGQHTSESLQTPSATALSRSHSQTSTSLESNRPRDDPRDPDNPNKALFNDLKERFPEASDNRLLEFTAVCHAHKITDKNLSMVHFNQDEGLVVFGSGGLMLHHAIVDLKQASPQPAQSIQRIQQHDQQQAQMREQTPLNNVQGQPGPALGGLMH